MSIKRVKFDVLSLNDVENYSTIELTRSETSLVNDDVENTVHDTRMGPVIFGQKCQTCFGTHETCPGHVGFIRLCKPVFNVLFMNTIYRILRTICISCGRVKGRTSEQACTFCFEQHATIKRESVHAVSSNKLPLSSAQVYASFRRIRQCDLDVLGIGVRPENMIIYNLIVLPPCARPAVQQLSGKWTCDPISYKYAMIIKANNTLKSIEYGNLPTHVIRDAWRTLAMARVDFIG